MSRIDDNTFSFIQMKLQAVCHKVGSLHRFFQTKIRDLHLSVQSIRAHQGQLKHDASNLDYEVKSMNGRICDLSARLDNMEARLDSADFEQNLSLPLFAPGVSTTGGIAEPSVLVEGPSNAADALVLNP